MEINIHIDAQIHIHGVSLPDLQPAIDKISKVTANAAATTANIKQAVNTAETPKP